MPTATGSAKKRSPGRSPQSDAESPASLAQARIAAADANDPGKYNPRSSYQSNRRGSFGTVLPPSANLLAMTTDGKRRGISRAQKPGFGGSSRRNLVLELLGEDAAGPGPGASLPSSTFGKHA